MTESLSGKGDFLLPVQSAQFSCSAMSDSLWPHGPQHTRPPCPSPTPRVCSNSCPLSQWCHPTTSSSVVPFSSCLQSFPASESFLVTRLYASGGQGIGDLASASVLPVNIQGESYHVSWISSDRRALFLLEIRWLSQLLLRGCSWGGICGD